MNFVLVKQVKRDINITLTNSKYPLGLFSLFFWVFEPFLNFAFFYFKVKCIAQCALITYTVTPDYRSHMEKKLQGTNH